MAVILILPWILSSATGAYPDYVSALRQFGIVPGFTKSGNVLEDLTNVTFSIAKMLLLYCGPITNYFVTNEVSDIKQDFQDAYKSIWGFRDHIFAPLTEELVYRAGVVAILQPYTSKRSIMLYSPFLFGLAHLHHGYQLFYKKSLPIAHIALHVAVQFAYTTVFGILANRFYLTTNENLLCPIVVHGICNLLGFPTFGMREAHPKWFYCYCLLLVGGVVMFFKVI